MTERVMEAGGLVAGDVILLPHGERRRVLRVQRYDELTGRLPGPRVLVIVAGGRQQAWEGVMSGHEGARSIDVDEQTLRPFLPNEMVKVERG